MSHSKWYINPCPFFPHKSQFCLKKWIIFSLCLWVYLATLPFYTHWIKLYQKKLRKWEKEKRDIWLHQNLHILLPLCLILYRLLSMCHDCALIWGPALLVGVSFFPLNPSFFLSPNRASPHLDWPMIDLWLKRRVEDSATSENPKLPGNIRPAFGSAVYFSP